MRRFKLLVFSEPFEGQDEAYNDWYTNRHLDDVCAQPGFTAAQRFKLHSVTMGSAPNRYLAIYEVETDDPDWVVENLFAKRDTPEMPLDPSFNLDPTNVILYEELTGQVFAK